MTFDVRAAALEIVEQAIIGEPRSQQRIIGPSEIGAEEWRTIPGTHGHYQASSFGRIRSVDRHLPQSGREGLRFHRGRVLSPSLVGSDRLYLGVTVPCFPGKQKVSRLVAMAFHGLGFPDEREVDHVDGDKMNNSAVNLEVVDHPENMARYSRNKKLCKRGHLRSGDNIIVGSRGERRCRECARFHEQKRTKRRREAKAV